MAVHLLETKKEFPALIESLYPERKRVYVVDSKVKLFHAGILNGIDSFPVFAGERAKSIVGVMDIQNQIINSETPDPVVIVIGGGTVLDIAGFALATFRKRLSTVFVPTTLGGQLEGFFKNEAYVNFDRVKDVMCSQFHPDNLVNVVEFVKTQSVEERRQSLIHAVDLGLSHSKKFFDSVDRIISSNLMSNEEVIKYVIFESLRMRANFGTTLVGEESARELITASKLDIPYLMALRYGVMMESFISNRLGFLSDEELGSVYRVLRMCSGGHFDLSSAVEELAYREEPLRVRIPVKIGMTIEYRLFPGFLMEMIYSAHSKGLI